MENHIDDHQLAKTMGLVLGLVVALIFVIVIAANILVVPTNVSPNQAKLTAMVDRITPVGSVRTSVEETQVATAGAESTSQSSNGKQLATVCLACHGAAIAAALKAPAVGDAKAWGERLSVGMDALVASAIKGKGAMPPRGGTSLSDDEIRLAVEYLSSAQ